MQPKLPSIDFHTFGERLWRIADVFRDDTLKTTEYLEEFSYFLFLKLWDEREQAEESAVRGASEIYVPYLPPDFRFHSWAQNPDQWAKDRGFPNSIAFVKDMFYRLAYVGDVVEVTDRVRAGELLTTGGERVDEWNGKVYIRCPSRQPEAHLFAPTERITRDLNLFRRLFSNFTLRVRYDPTIRELAARLLDLNLGEVTASGWDVFGRAYEFVVNKLGEQKQYGQYFTPRHIIKYMVEMIDPEPGQVIYDPASGTAGFLIRAYIHVKDKIGRRILKGEEQEIALRRLKNDCIWGVEKAPDVYKLGVMNMVLHGDGNAHLDLGDSLSSEAQQRFKNHADVILANPPLGPTAQERTATFEYHIRLYEALFIQHMMTALKEGGHLATVMKEGLLFGSQSALVNIRRKLIEEFDVQAVISLSNGVFNPYSIAKTSILVFHRPRAGSPPTSRVWFYAVENDGRDLGVTRRILDLQNEDGDLPDMLLRWKGELSRESERSWTVDVDAIRANGYDLRANTYRPYQITTATHEPPNVLLGRIMDLEQDILQGLNDLLEIVS